ncbi:Scr1 family TA system antitoxin-like transcriptional regulator [Saccharothrix coeruleofusca]|uniref:Scr1 family TA system antitoxin-like transcriptional regulator n=1 Tax=Saccharothrix coeruleofusca TaxID=33919 RepID=UPI00227D81AA|nr:Scr1 family TA system antitoxin-like transcriptional regulator [Saccharothrix coeruleofusca]
MCVPRGAPNPSAGCRRTQAVGVRHGGLTVLDFGGTAPDVAFAPTTYGPSTYFDDKADTATLSRAFKKVQGLARDHEASLDLIRGKPEG